MKILFDNLAIIATLSSAHPNSNYPVDNVINPFLKKIYKSTEISDTITMSWTSDQIIDSCFVDLTNATSATLVLKNSSGSTLKTQAITPVDIAVYFDAVSGVRSATLTFSHASDVVYLGAIGIGLAYTMPIPLSNWKKYPYDLSSKTSSLGGQVQTNKIAPLNKMIFNFKINDRDQYEEISELVGAVSAPVFFDFTNLNHIFCLPYYADIESGFESPDKSDNIFSFTLTFTEAR
jgi:hypothetical protein